MVHMGHVNKTAPLCIPKKEEQRKATTGDCNMRYIKKILSGMEEI